MKRKVKIVLAIIAVICLGFGLWIANGFYGNPVSKMIAGNAAKKHIAATYADTDLVVDEVFYNFKSGDYEAKIKSPSSIDTHFTVSVNLNKVRYDSYEDDVLSGWNTYIRIDSEYMKMVERIFDSPNFPIKSDIDFGTIPIEEIEYDTPFDQPDFGLKLAELELDKIYDVKEIAKTKGHIIYYAQDEDVSFEKASELLLLLKQLLDDAAVPFYAINFNLEKPRTEDGGPRPDNIWINTANFLYDDIVADGLAERLEKAHNELTEFYEEQDALMEEELNHPNSD